MAGFSRPVAAWIAAPAVVGALGLVLVEAWGALWAEPPQAPRPSGQAFLTALRSVDVERAFGLVQAGQDPNALLLVSDFALTGGRELKVRPLIVAVAANNENAVSMLLSNGARMELSGNRAAACLAEHLGHAGLATIVRRAVRSGPPIECGPPPTGAEAVLLPFAE